jgi:L-asparaginase / beta-aspartyl-peptidase
MISLVVHGGAWEIPDDAVAAHRAGVLKAAKAGWAILLSGGPAAEAVEQAVVTMEDDETFNAGRGSFINLVGEVELDAGIMEGANFNVGAVAAVQRIAHPVSLARLIMEKSDHVLLAGMGAARFAQEHGLSLCGKDELITGKELLRWRQVQGGKNNNRSRRGLRKKREACDTVGAVALDKAGNIVAASSTGGIANKYPGRVSDAPMAGCGFYADNQIGGTVIAGAGEEIARVVLAKSVVEAMDRNGGDAHDAGRACIELLKRRTGGRCGIIALNRKGDVGIAYNTPRMARSYISTGMKAPFVSV